MNTPSSKQPLPDKAKKVFSGIIFDVYHWEQELYDGTTKTFEKLRRPATVLVVPITTDNQILLLDQEQPGKPPFLGLAGGRVEEDEEPELGARRELLEETGYEAGEMILIDVVHPQSKIDWLVYTYVARGCRKVGEQSLDAGEKIAVRSVSFEEAVEVFAADDFVDKDCSLARLALRATYDPAKKEELRKLLLG